ncbi:DUF4422 domain-containing protein [Pseudoflavonifractor sp. 524-17]|uniref:DUF4422 domain-containing protein n=1 Tax=Pseudoflavonifractor sp. 524-17 TaxID=2304577 RepID=UPI00137B90B8|nr:DUF4422 domain-containing protein [Pseudoflavonifractor sp. 524-17]
MPMPCDAPDIKIFVSRRIDLDSAAVDNPLYVPVRCGAVFDPGADARFQGDDTGDNISQKRMSFCEFTVQYWAWKNAQADYYGLCHYRRYLSFAPREYRPGDHGLVPCAVLSPRTMRRFGLLDRENMAAEIARYDLVIPQPAAVERMPLPHGTAKTVRQLWEAHDGLFFEKKVIDRMFSLIKELAPEYSASARAYFGGGLHRGYNCYVMSQVLFDRLCRFQFPIMEAVERELDTAGCTPEMRRTPAYVGEMLFGIFLHHVITNEQWRVSQRQLVLFGETRAMAPAALARWYATYWLDRLTRAAVKPFFPLGSNRREACKKVYYRLTRAGINERE